MARNMYTIHSVTSKYTNVRASVQLPSQCKRTCGELKNTVLVGCSLELSILCVTRLFTLWPAAKRDFSSTNKIVTNENIVQYVCFTMANFGKVITWQSNTDVLDVLLFIANDCSIQIQIQFTEFYAHSVIDSITVLVPNMSARHLRCDI